MRHGRKRRSKRFNGCKPHLLGDVESRVMKDVVVRPANEPEQDAIDSLKDALEPESGLNQLTIDLGYAGHPKIREWEAQGVTIVTRPWPQHERGVFSKNKFLLDVATMRITCPAGEDIPMVLGTPVHVPASRCQTCELRTHCMSGKPNTYRGRGVTIRADEDVQQARREAMKTAERRAERRTRVGVEQRISHQVASQGRKARYLGTRKNQYDGRRHAAVIHVQLAQQYYEKRQGLPKTA
ncbi:MAG: transposase [Candidatus Tectomicrobia bacterium]|nr:transposase [Candidatus Tectomicrobia bacterium]